MKKITLIAAIVASTFSLAANAEKTSANVNITGKIIPSSCTIQAGANGGTIDFGTLHLSDLQLGSEKMKKSDTLNVTCETETTAVIKVSGSNGKDQDIRYKTNKEFVNYGVLIDNLETDTSNNTIVVSKTEMVDLKNINSADFKSVGSSGSAAFPVAGNYFAASRDGSSVGTFKTLTARYTVGAIADKNQAKLALADGEQVFNSTVVFELEYL